MGSERRATIGFSSAVGPLYGRDAGVGPTSVGVFLREYCHPDDRPKLDEALDLLVNQDRPADLRFRALTASGEERLLDAHARLMRDRDGRPLRLVGVVHRAGYGDRRFRDLADAAPVLMWATGPDLACTFFNAAYMRFTGRRLEDELGEGWLDLVHPDDVGVVRAADARAEGGRAPFEARYRLRRHDGVYRWMHDSGIPVFSSEGRFEGLTGGMVDLHDVIEREVMLDGIFAGAPVGLALFDPDLRIRRVNDSYAQITGAAAAAHVGRRVEEVFPGIAAATTALLAQVLRTAEPATGLLVAGPAAGEDGPARRFEASFIPLVLPGGEVAGLASMLSEVTDRHEAEQRMAQLYRERVEVASTLQTALLPPELPVIEGIELAARYLPADEASEVGGDFYDVFRAGTGWGVIVGDVCGKGPKAAAATALARYTVRASFASGAPGPVEALELLDTTLIAEHDGDRFVTAVLGVLELRDERARRHADGVRRASVPDRSARRRQPRAARARRPRGRRRDRRRLGDRRAHARRR